MARLRVAARELWRPMEIRFGGERIRVPINGWVDFNYRTKIFAGSGNGQNEGNPRRNSTIISATTDEFLTQGGMRLQSYWQMQYDISIGDLSRIGRSLGVRSLGGTRVEGLLNILQNFDVLPGRGRSEDYEVTFRNVSVDSRGGSMALWEFELGHDRSVTYSGDLASISTTTTARLPVDFSTALSAEVSAQVGVELSIEPVGIGGGASASTGASAGASVSLTFRRRLELTMQAEIVVPTRVAPPRGSRR